MVRERATDLSFGNHTVSLPCFVPSVSSVKCPLPPVAYVEILAAVRHSQFLVSAYDIGHAAPKEREQFERLVSEAMGSGSVVFLDSGNYERYWKANPVWTAQSFREVAASLSYTVGFCYDNLQPADSPRAIARDVVKRVIADQSCASSIVVPIVHAPRELLAEATCRVATALSPRVVAVPERRLGDGVLERMRTLWLLRRSLDAALEYYCPIHLLGTGDPLSIAGYAFAGADSFDGLEWCRSIIDHEDGRLRHFHHWDLIKYQTSWGMRDGIPYVASAIMHNLAYYTAFMADLRTAIENGDRWTFLQRFATDEQAAELLLAADGTNAE